MQSPAFGCVINNILYNFFNSPGMKTSIVVRIQQALVFYHIPIQPVLTFRTPTTHSHEMKLPRTDFEAVGIRKSDTLHHIVRASFRSLIGEKYDKRTLIITDGSKSEKGVGALRCWDQTK